MEDLIGKAFGPYTITEKIGEGGMAIVYKGYQESLNRYVAIKVLRGELAGDEEFITRFRREALAVAKLSHPNILHVYDAAESQGMYYIVMDYVAGGSLKNLIAQGPLETEQAISIAAQLADALDHAHQQGLVHRDVKPSNVLLRGDGRPQLTDFGIAKTLYEGTRLTRTGTSIGTPEYMAPEQAQGQPADGRTDIYALGIVLYEMLAGVVPFSAPTPVAALYMHVNQPPPPLRRVKANIPAWLEAVVDRSLAKHPGRRYQRAGEFAEVLRQRRAPDRVKKRARPGQKASASAPSIAAGQPAERPRREKLVPVLLGGIALLLLALLAGGAYLFLSGTGQALPAETSPPVVAAATTPAPTATLAPTLASSPTPSPSPTATSLPTTEPDTPTPVVIVVTPTSAPTSSPTPTPAPTETSPPSPTPTRASPTKTPTPGSGSSPTDAPTPTAEATVIPSSAGSLAGNIAFTVYNAGLGSYTLYTVKPDGSGLHAVADYVHQPDISPNGKSIVVDGVGGGKNDLWSFKLDGTGWQHWTQYPDDHFPVWSPNGKVVAFSSTRQGDGVYRLYTNTGPVGTGQTKFILGDYVLWVPTWEFVFQGCDYGWGTGAKCGLWRASDGYTPAQITGDPVDIPTDSTADQVLFLRPDGDNWDIYRVALSGGAPVRLTDNPGRDGPAAFSPDGRTIVFLSDRSGAWALYTMNLQGGDTKKRLDLPLGGNYDAAPQPWTSERLSWGASPAAPTPAPTAVDAHLLPAPTLLFPIPDDEVSSVRPTTIKWSWSQKLGFNQGFEVRFWHSDDSGPMGIAPPTAETQLEVNLGFTEAYRRHGEGTYYLEVVVVQLNPYKILSKNARIRVKTNPNK